VHRPIRAVRLTGLTALNLSAHRSNQAAARPVTWDFVTGKVAASPGFEMSHQSAPPEAVYIIRHGEKPQDLGTPTPSSRKAPSPASLCVAEPTGVNDLG
jgi:hypothetical protein